MTLVVDIADETDTLSDEHKNEVKKILIHAAEQELGEIGAELSVLFVTNERIQQFNNEYRNQDVPTDVLSFPMEDDILESAEDLPGVNNDMPRLLGDIIISTEKVQLQAKEYGHSILRELVFLSVHGFLHLIGYDHETVEDEELMFKKQKEILDSYGISR